MSEQTTEQTNERSEEISLLTLLVVLAKHKRLVAGAPLAVAIIATLYSLTLAHTFTGTTRVLPPQSQSASAGIVAQLGGLATLAGGLGAFKDPADVYVAMLKSRTVADKLVQRFDLVRVRHAATLTEARTALERATQITSGRGGIITVEVTDQDAKRAAELANGYVEELSKLTNVLAVTEASQRRLFFERQLTQAKDGLAKAEGEARQSLLKGGLVQVEGQSKAMIENTARLRAQITVKEVHIGAMRVYATGQNPEMVAAQKELEAMKQELAKLEGMKDSQVPEQTVDDRGMESVRLLRNVKYYETILELLAKQYELAKLDESRDSGMVQVLDLAVEPDVRSGPKRTQIVLVATLVALFLAVLLALLLEGYAKARNDPQQAARLQAIRRYIAWR